MVWKLYTGVIYHRTALVRYPALRFQTSHKPVIATEKLSILIPYCHRYKEISREATNPRTLLAARFVFRAFVSAFIHMPPHIAHFSKEIHNL